MRSAAGNRKSPPINCDGMEWWMLLRTSWFQKSISSCLKGEASWSSLGTENDLLLSFRYVECISIFLSTGKSSHNLHFCTSDDGRKGNHHTREMKALRLLGWVWSKDEVLLQWSSQRETTGIVWRVKCRRNSRWWGTADSTSSRFYQLI